MFPFSEEEEDWCCERCGNPTLHGNPICEECELEEFLNTHHFERE